MSAAIRCWQCRWWESEGDESDYGHCHLNPPVYTGGAPLESTNWYQPVTYFKDHCSYAKPKPIPLTMSHEGCSRGELKTEDAT